MVTSMYMCMRFIQSKHICLFCKFYTIIKHHKLHFSLFYLCILPNNKKCKDREKEKQMRKKNENSGREGEIRSFISFFLLFAGTRRVLAFNLLRDTENEVHVLYHFPILIFLSFSSVLWINILSNTHSFMFIQYFNYII